MRPILVGFCTALLLNPCASAQSPVSHVVAPAPAAKLEIRPVPPELTRRFEPLYAALKPSARDWIDLQAKIEAQRPRPNLNALRAAIRQRFPLLFPPAGFRQPGAASLQQSDSDIDAVVFVVLAQTAQSVQANIEADAQQIQALTQDINALRQALEQLNQDMAALQKSARRDSPCNTPSCRSLPSTLAFLNKSSANLRHSTHFQAPARLTLAQLQALVNQMESALSTVGDDAQLANVDLQNTLQKQSQTLQLISDTEKTMHDTAMSIIANLK